MCHCNGIPNRVMFRVEGLFLARSSEGFKQGSGEDRVVAQSVALSRNGYWTQRLGVVFKDCHLIGFSKLGSTSLRSSGLLRYHHPLGNVFRT